ncbi:MAG: hypothetical protein JWM45_3343 [Pseudonocardiales bacterium]|jgi:hypothetical protein|nr:hypothetical protein [Pseudonocardiales bacterium]
MTPGSHRQGAFVDGFGGASASSRHVVVSVSRDLAGLSLGLSSPRFGTHLLLSWLGPR